MRMTGGSVLVVASGQPGAPSAAPWMPTYSFHVQVMLYGKDTSIVSFGAGLVMWRGRTFDMKIKRQARNNIIKRPDIFGNSNAVFRVSLQKLAIFLRCKKGTKGKGKRETKGASNALETPAKPQKITCQMGHPIGGNRAIQLV